MTIKPLVNLLNIEKKKDEQKLITEEVNDTVLDHIMSGVDVISGKRGKQYFQVSESILLQFDLSVCCVHLDIRKTSKINIKIDSYTLYMITIS